MLWGVVGGEIAYICHRPCYGVRFGESEPNASCSASWFNMYILRSQIVLCLTYNVLFCLEVEGAYSVYCFGPFNPHSLLRTLLSLFF